MQPLLTLRRRAHLLRLVGPLPLAWAAAACSSDAPPAVGPHGGAAATAGTNAGGSSNSPSAGSTSQAGGSAGSVGTSGGAPANGGAGAVNGGAAVGGSGGNAGSGGANVAGGGASSGGTWSGGAGGAAPTGTCPTTLPALAADGDTSFYANRQGIAHGVVKEVTYKAGVDKTMHVYTPPGYETNTATSYPVLYINHGGGESDVHWGCTNANNCGYAGRILDNLLADGKAVPMVIAMPDTGDCANFTPPKPPAFDDPCTTQYVNDFIPYVEKTYRVKADRHSRAIAGLSMGGLVTLSTGFAHLELFSHVFVYSSGYMADTRPQWETNLSSVLGDSKATNGLLNAPIYLAAGSSDSALPNAQAMLGLFEKHEIEVLWQPSSLGHEWANWRRYLAQTLPLMFKNTSGCD